MRPLTRDDVLPIDEFTRRRPALLREVRDAKALRRIHLGPNMTLVFENHTTVLWQVHEMCRVENITRPEGVEDELEAYNPLLPTADSLSGTLMVEYPDAVERATMLVRLSGLDQHLRLEFDGADAAPAAFEGGREKESGKISSVQFLRFPLDEAQRAALMDLGRGARLVIDHPAYGASVELSAATRGALVDDLRAE